MVYIVRIYCLQDGYWERADEVFFTKQDLARECLDRYCKNYTSNLPEGETYEWITNHSLFDSKHGVMITLDSTKTDLPIEGSEFLIDLAKGV